MISKIAAILVLFAVFGSGESIKYKNQDVYNSFLWNVEHQADLEGEQRRSELMFLTSDNVENPDRHGQLFVKCAIKNSTSDEPDYNQRCLQQSQHTTPMCSLTFDLDLNEIIQDCYHAQSFDTDLCSDECNLTLSPRSFMGNRKMRKVFGFCCCKTDKCNHDSKAIIGKAIARAVEYEAAMQAKEQQERMALHGRN